MEKEKNETEKIEEREKKKGISKKSLIFIEGFLIIIAIIMCILLSVNNKPKENEENPTKTKTFEIETELNSKETIGKLTYSINKSWENSKEKSENNTYYYPTDDTILMITIDSNEEYRKNNFDTIFSEFVNGLEGGLEEKVISKNKEKINGFNCGIVKYILNSEDKGKYETISYIIHNNNELYVFSFGQKGKLNDKCLTLIKDIASNTSIIKETEEEKQARIQKETEEKARKEAEEKAKKEQDKQSFIASCNVYTYQQMARNPENFKGTNVKLTGEVIQALYSNDSVDLRVNITKTGTYSTWYTDTIYVVYYPEVGEDKILEDDIITIYGTAMGDYTYKSAIGSPVTLPLINGKYITINK